MRNLLSELVYLAGNPKQNDEEQRYQKEHSRSPPSSGILIHFLWNPDSLSWNSRTLSLGAHVSTAPVLARR